MVSGSQTPSPIPAVDILYRDVGPYFAPPDGGVWLNFFSGLGFWDVGGW